jgi:hypothetical protein
MSDKPKSYALGDIVTYKNRLCIIIECKMTQGRLKYGLSLFGAWYYHDDEDLKFVSRANKGSMAKLAKEH